MDVLPLLTATQLGELAVTPGQLRDPTVVGKILDHVKDDVLGHFFDVVSPAIQVCEKLILNNPLHAQKICLPKVTSHHIYCIG